MPPHITDGRNHPCILRLETGRFGPSSRGSWVKGPTPDWTRWRRKLQLPLIHNKALLAEITELVSDIASGKAHPRIAQRLRATRATVLRKPNKKPRSTEAECLWFKLASRAVIERVQGRLAATFVDPQYGVGGNIEVAIARLHRTLRGGQKD